MHSTKPMISVSSLIFTVTVGLLLGPFNLGNAADAGKPLIDNNGWCLVKKADKLQIAFVLDRTKSYEEFGIKLAKDVLPKVVDKLKSQYKEVTYALTTFADYTEAQGPVLIPRTDANAISGRDDLEDIDER
ncbi:Ribonucleoside-diphosphate reductase large subunit [Orchesella cincta]|uniref:Ribonucleoside-diphosphate reductase large subunit n=1 Tax=Orchesella cincta TaxID=48709 RepID=A0A1D2NHD2_ORCCI|nr:Ribonucleoside-diphosphate reductase large subunit [Orchesella cincta]